MRTSVEMLCLANSIKHAHRCLAGIRLDTGGWIRPVSDIHGSALVPSQYRTASGSTPTPLDTVRFEIQKPSPKYNQPENWVISEDDWELVDTELHARQCLALNTALQRQGDPILDDQCSIPKPELRNIPAVTSLTVLIPNNPVFKIKDGEQPRAEFSFNGNKYDLSITDPTWRNAVEDGSRNSLPSADEVADDKEILFTISLGQEFEGHCHKLVAAIFSVKTEQLMHID